MEKEKPPVFGMIQRGGLVVLHLLANVKQKTIEPFIKDTIKSGTLVYTDEYSIYARLERWGYAHKSVNHGRGEYARDEEQNPQSSRQNALPVKLIDGALLMGHKYLTCALV